MAPERLRSGGASPEDDVYALGLTLWETWTCKVPEPGYRPRARRMREQIMFDVPSRLTVEETKQVFRCMSENPTMRPQAKHLRFFNPAKMTVSPVQVPRERLDPGPPLGRGLVQTFTPGAQALVVTYASNAPEAIGKVYPLDRPAITIGRRGDQDIVVPESTVSGAHCAVKWQAGCWTFEDAGSTNGTYADHNYERRPSVALMHGGEVQLGEIRFKLVTFGAETPQHKRARQFLAHRDGLTFMLSRDALLAAVDEEGAFCDWAEMPLTVARYELRGPNRMVSERPTILEMLALRRAAQRCVELTETLLMSMTPVVAGRAGPLRFCIAMAGPSVEESRTLVEQVVAQVQSLLPERIELFATIVKGEPGCEARSLVDY
jgi:serine/threonine-protein kinase